MIFMVRMLKRIFLLSVLMLAVVRAGAFSLLGPLDVWQDGIIGYGLGGDLGGPQNLGEEYRVNRPVLYYACNQNFHDYFGSNGVFAVEQAGNMFNVLTNLTGLSADLSEFPLEASRINYQAEALTLHDVKSLSMWAFAEQLGLSEPDRFTWTLRDRIIGPGGCPADVTYAVIKRNFDPVVSPLDQLQSSSYVNGTLYSYRILEFCTGPNPLADAVEFAVDPTANTFTAVASHLTQFYPGKFFTGITRDDVGGLRYMLRTNNMNIESAGDDTITFVTNNTIELLFTSNLTELATASLTNNAVALAALFPGLQIGNTTTIFTNLVTTNTIFYFTNSPFDPYGSPARLVTVTVVTTNVATQFRHQFANVVTNRFFTNGTVTILTTNVTATACPPLSPYGSICSNVSVFSYVTNGVFGDYFLLPTNSCEVSIVVTQLVQLVNVTNATIVATNAVGTTNVANEFFSQTLNYTFNQYIFQIRRVECPANTVALRQGVNRLRLERREYDSLNERFFYPITNDYVLMAITNSSLVPQRIRRLITEPDFLFTAQDSGITPYAIERVGAFFDEANALPLLNGPGRMVTPVEFRLNKSGPIYLNHPAFLPGSLDEQSQQTLIIWASFDGSTNAPVLYPNGTSIQNLENQVLIQISPAGPALPNGILGQNYTNAFSGFTVTVGGTPPFTWSLPGPAGLPPGLALNPNTGRISGVPTTQGVYDFTIRMTDGISRFVDRNYSVTITP